MKKHTENYLRNEARDKECQVRIPGVCNKDKSTTVLAHPNNKRLFGVGVGQKVPDLFGAWACSACHDVIDGRVPTGWPDLQVLVWFYEGCFRTQNILLQEGKICTT